MLQQVRIRTKETSITHYSEPEGNISAGLLAGGTALINPRKK